MATLEKTTTPDDDKKAESKISATTTSTEEMTTLPLSNVTEVVATSPHLSSEPTPLTKMQASLLDTLSELSIQKEVQECVNSMLVDVEATFYLQQALQVQATQHAMEMTTKHHQATILEANAERRARESHQLGLADQMVQEVMTLSQELEELLQWKRDHVHKVEEYEELVAKLAQTEDDLLTAKQEQAAQRNIAESQPKKKAEDDSTTEALEESKEEIPMEEQKPPATTSIPEEGSAAPPVSDGPSETQEESASTTEPTAAAAPSTEAVVQEKTTEDDKPAVAEESSLSSGVEPVATAAAAVTLDVDEPEEEAPSLADVDVEILMTIFGFLDAMDILNMAQISLSMYSKIDNIFGISEDGQSPPQAPAPTPAARPPAPAPAPAASRPETSLATTTGSSSTSPAGSTAATATSGPIGNRLFSMLQPARTGPAGAKKPAQGLTPTVAQSMASKLSDAELAAILSMTDKLNKMDKEVSILRNEKEAMVAKLDGTEAVKQFLINKVRDVETKLGRSRDDEIKVTQQIASDQEVIAFLDSRVQELERQTETLTKDKSGAQSELDTIKVQTSKKITMLSDMLKYEREKLKDEEGEWKATKKVLVKEVKSCRAQILALQAERDGLKEQNEMLKRAIVSTGKSPARSTSPLR
jgi:hypothetical protein